MLVGKPMAGKTTALRALIDSLNKLHYTEWGQKYTIFMRRKGRRLGIKTKVIKEKCTLPGMEN